ncbi:MAG: DUF547 domain-containing protein [Bacteroidales bacterium]|nr:DUF547 domain-containing protein [Bacteroidales bacterium]MCF8403726.1 DUF547 domain-containing protein [Bacteroidales bacterium]
MKLLNTCLILLVTTLSSIYSYSQNIDDHNQWDKLLKQFVSEKGEVDYNGFKNARHELDLYLNALSKTNATSLSGNNEKLAFWINAYNAFTVELIIDHYPLKSIMDIEKAWDISFIHINGTMYSLNQIEHEIIRKEFNEPRIHFALVCAAISCPVLFNEAYTASNLDSQLQRQGELFINDPSKNNITNSKVDVSQIFNWFKEDFTKNGTLIGFLNQFSRTRIEPDAKVNFNEYNWSLNGK